MYYLLKRAQVPVQQVRCSSSCSKVLQHQRCSRSTSKWPQLMPWHDSLQHSTQCSLPTTCKSMSSEMYANQEFGLQMAPAAADELERDKEWISSMIATWLDEEWTPLDTHQQLGAAAGAAYVTCRQAGDDDMSSLVLGLSNELLAFNYRDTFVNAFEVANKVVEMLMMRSGIAVCCTSDQDVQRMERLGGTDSSTDPAQ